MNLLHTTDINEFEALATVAKELPTKERALFTALTGAQFDTEEFLVSMAEFVGDSPYHYLIWAGDAPVAAGGFLPQRPGVFRTWFIAPDASWEHYGRELTDLCRDQIERMLQDKLAHRIETVTLADRTEARAWYERIGLTFESTLPGYGANCEDAVMYVAVRKPETY